MITDDEQSRIENARVQEFDIPKIQDCYLHMQE